MQFITALALFAGVAVAQISSEPSGSNCDGMYTYLHFPTPKINTDHVPRNLLQPGQHQRRSHRCSVVLRPGNDRRQRLLPPPVQ